METPEPLFDNFSQEYFNYIREKVRESPLSLTGNKFFPDYIEATKNAIDATNSI